MALEQVRTKVTISGDYEDVHKLLSQIDYLHMEIDHLGMSLNDIWDNCPHLAEMIEATPRGCSISTTLRIGGARLTITAG